MGLIYGTDFLDESTKEDLHYENMVLTEGANLDATKKLIALKKEYKKVWKEAIKNIKKNDIDASKRSTERLKAICKETREEIQKVEFSSIENGIGFLIGIGFTFVISFISGYVTLGIFDCSLKLKY